MLGFGVGGSSVASMVNYPFLVRMECEFEVKKTNLSAVAEGVDFEA